MLLVSLVYPFVNLKVINAADNLNAVDNAPVLLDSTTIDHYGFQTVMQGSSEDQAIENTNAGGRHPLGNDESLILKLEELAIVGDIQRGKDSGAPVDSLENGSFSTGWMLDDQLNNFKLTDTLTLPRARALTQIQGKILSPVYPFGEITYHHTYTTFEVWSIDSGNFDNDSAEELIVVGANVSYFYYGPVFDPLPSPPLTCVAFVYNSITVIIYDDRANNYTEIKRYDFADPRLPRSDLPREWKEGFNPSPNLQLWGDVVAGDFDGDCIDEFAMVLSDGAPYDARALRPEDISIDLYIYDLKNDTANKIDWQISGLHSRDTNVQPKLAAGDLDGDGLDELVLAQSLFGLNWEQSYLGWVFEYSNDQYSENEEYRWTNPLSLRYQNRIALGDIDGDLRDEIIYLMGWYVCIENVETIKSGSNMDWIDITKTVHLYERADLVLGAGDVDADGVDEIVVFALQSADTRLNEKTECGVIFDYAAQEFNATKIWRPGNINIVGSVSKELTLGDVDADAGDEIILSTGDNLTSYTAHYALGEAGTRTTIFDDANGDYQLIFNDTERTGFVTTGDFDADGIQLKYTKEHWTTTSPPKPIMAVAAPPSYIGVPGIVHNTASTYTAFGQSTSRGVMEGNSLGAYEGVHWSAGLKLDGKVGFLKVEESFAVRATMMRELLRTETKTVTFCLGEGWNFGYLDNSVIYQRTVFANYKYQITSHPTKPKAILSNLTLDIPTHTGLWKAAITDYNLMVQKDFAAVSPQIGSETFSHTVGQPWTYPNSSSIDSISLKRWESNKQNLGQMVGSNKVYIGIENVSTTEMSSKYTSELCFDTSRAAGVNIEDPITGSEVGVYLTSDFGYKSASINAKLSAISVGNSSLYEGSVGDIEDFKFFEKALFSFKLVVYNLERPEKGIQYQVVNYIVDGAPDVTQDTDGDGLTDLWETIYGLNPLDAADASIDSDGDGLTDFQEYQGNTDPYNYFSPFPLWIVGVAPVAVVGVAGLIYFIRRRKAS